MKRTRERCTQGQNEWAEEGADRIGRRRLREKEERGKISEMLHRFEEGGETKGFPNWARRRRSKSFFLFGKGLGKQGKRGEVAGQARS